MLRPPNEAALMGLFITTGPGTLSPGSEPALQLSGTHMRARVPPRKSLFSHSRKAHGMTQHWASERGLLPLTRALVHLLI